MYYSGNSDVDGNLWMDPSSAAEKISCQDIVKRLHDSRFTGKFFLALDCSLAGRWLYNCQRLFRDERDLFRHFKSFHVTTYSDANTKIPWGATRPLIKAQTQFLNYQTKAFKSGGKDYHNLVNDYVATYGCF